MGKTSLALQYYKAQKRAYDSGFVFIDAQSVITMKTTLEDYVRKDHIVKTRGCTRVPVFLVSSGKPKVRRRPGEKT